MIDLATLITSLPVGIWNIIRTLGIVVIVYVIFLIISSIVNILYSIRFRKLAKNVEEINEKMDYLIGKKSKKFK